MGKFILKVAGTLTVISLVVAALLGVVNMVTEGPITATYSLRAMESVTPSRALTVWFPTR